MSDAGRMTLGREIADAGRGVAGLVWYDPQWPNGFDATAQGFVRSFLGPLLALPFAVLASALAVKAGTGQDASAAALWAVGLSHGADALIYPLVIALLARPLGVAQGFAGFIVVVNWASLFLNMMLAAAAGLALAGGPGVRLFAVAAMALFALSVFVTWRAARETLSPEVAPPLLMVVLAVAVGAASDQASGWLVGALS